LSNGNLSVLLIEDSPDDAFFLERVLRKSGYYPDIRRVETEDALRATFDDGVSWDIVITDYRLPEFSGLRAIRLVTHFNPFLPVILVSGRVGEETAVEAIRAGAKDYVLKDNLTRLPSVVEREINTARHKWEREKVQQALHDSEERFAIMFKISPDPIVMTVGPQAKLVDANESFLTLLGTDLESVQRRSLDAFLLPEGGIKVGELTKRLRGSDGMITLQSGVFPDAAPENREAGRTVLWSVRRIPGSEETLLIWTGKDMTEHEALDRKLRESEKLRSLGTLAGGIAHDFNNILMVMMGYAEMALERVEENKRLERYLTEIYGSVLRAKELIQQILTFSRGTEGERNYLQVTPVIKEVLKLLRPSLPPSIRIASRIESEYYVYADPTHIHQIVMNLCVNSFHAMKHEGGVLTITAGDLAVGDKPPCCSSQLSALQEQPRVYLNVEDTGVGMTQEVKERAFEPFFTTRDVSEGTGLGLSMIHGIVESYGGQIGVESEPGKGTSIICCLPATVAQQPKMEHRKAADTELQPGGTVLLVDDEGKIGEVLSLMLSELGYDVILRRSGSEALDVLREKSKEIDCLITDGNMPGMTGGELNRRVKDISPLLPVIICSGDEDVQQQEAGYSFATVVPKPVRKTTLAKVVANAVAESDNNKRG